jgi:hypothetical protein
MSTSSNTTIKRWSFLLDTNARPRLDAIAQETLDRYRERAFPRAIRYPITDTRGNRHDTLSAFRSSDYWDYLNAKVIYEHGGACDACDGVQDLYTYHLSYEHIGGEENYPDEIIVLCAACHDYLGQQEFTGRRYGWKVQPLESWLYISKQAKQRLAAKLMMENLTQETEAPATTVEELVERLSAVGTETSVSVPKRNSTPPVRHFPTDEAAAPHAKRINIRISGEVSFPAKPDPDDMVLEIDGKIVILPIVRD